ncbi:MAG: hypothetical protein NZ534_11625, partial [Bacteroidia bacterium]|nr:hypothetical protein [Bacteroidia bacterium]
MKLVASWLNYVFGRLYALTARWCLHPNDALRVFASEGLEVEPAFVAGGKVFYRFSNPEQTPAHRAAAMQAAAKELDMGVSREELLAFLKLVDDHLNKKVSATELSKALFVIHDKTKWAVEPYCLMKLAAATFFAADESPFYHTEVAARKKIELWSKNAHENFFLTWPL